MRINVNDPGALGLQKSLQAGSKAGRIEIDVADPASDAAVSFRNGCILLGTDIGARK